MPIQVKCGGCGNEITVTDAMEGKRGRCPQCDAVVKIPRKGGRRKSRSANRDAPRHTPSYAALMGFAKFLSILAFAGLLGLTFIGVYTGITAMVHGPEGFYGPVHLFQEYAEEHVDHPTLVGIGFIVGGLILVFGHLLNIGLGMIALFAHGVRLNMLEFSNNLGMTWSGYPFKPFAKKNTQAEER